MDNNLCKRLIANLLCTCQLRNLVLCLYFPIHINCILQWHKLHLHSRQFFCKCIYKSLILHIRNLFILKSDSKCGSALFCKCLLHHRRDRLGISFPSNIHTGKFRCFQFYLLCIPAVCQNILFSLKRHKHSCMSPIPRQMMDVISIRQDQYL